MPTTLQLREYQKDLEYRLHHRLSKFVMSVFLILKPISYFFCFLMFFFNLEIIGVPQTVIQQLAFEEKKTFLFWREIRIQVVVILLQLHNSLDFQTVLRSCKQQAKGALQQLLLFFLRSLRITKRLFALQHIAVHCQAMPELNLTILRSKYFWSRSSIYCFRVFSNE